MIDFVAVGKGQFHIAQYQATSLRAAIEKLKQFPSGSQFLWGGNSTDESGNRALAELRKALQTSGIAITQTPSR